ncbi:MAG TPA: hypothetical protein VIF60_05750, partial [Burkholderiaceae bacterium]
FMLIVHFFQDAVESNISIALIFISFAFSGAVVGPVFTACGFTLYLNRRATLEAWDLEIALRQIQPPQRKFGHAIDAKDAVALMAPFIAALLFSLVLPVGQARAAEVVADNGKCEVPESTRLREATRKPDLNPEQAKIRAELAALYQSDELRTYSCAEHWTWKDSKDSKPEHGKLGKPPNLSWLATALQVFLIAVTIGLIAWLMYHFRDKFGGFGLTNSPRRATEIAGLDIRPESLPDDVPGEVMALWRQRRRREALALLYRATISRLVHDDGLKLEIGATEGDCSRLAERACHEGQLNKGRMTASAMVTQLWLRGAYADVWPDDLTMQDGCKTWGAEFPVETGRGRT